MRRITAEQLRETKQSDTLVIYGCGYSINRLSADDLEQLQQFDSIGFNWLCKSGIPTTHYLIREQGNIPKRRTAGEQPCDLIETLNNFYKTSTLIVLDQSEHTPDGYAWHKEDSLTQRAYITRDIKLDGNASGVSLWQTRDIGQGLIHGKTTITNVLHLSVVMGYERLVFAGVDLYDSRYFWLAENESRSGVTSKGKTYADKHATATATLEVISEARRAHGQRMNVYNNDSLLAMAMPVYQAS